MWKWKPASLNRNELGCSFSSSPVVWPCLRRMIAACAEPLLCSTRNNEREVPDLMCLMLGCGPFAAHGICPRAGNSLLRAVFGAERYGICSWANSRTESIRIDLSEFGAQKKNLRRIVDPEKNNH